MIKMRNNNEWLKRKIRYWLYRRSLLMRLYYKIEGLIWLMVGVCACMIVFKFIFFLGF